MTHNAKLITECFEEYQRHYIIKFKCRSTSWWSYLVWLSHAKNCGSFNNAENNLAKNLFKEMK